MTAVALLCGVVLAAACCVLILASCVASGRADARIEAAREERP